ncbi:MULTISPECIES: DUF421 domain-containing protein [Snodgrassella]|uniref:DUF421 domain-containing protein n=2 Tax=Snodgrassella alvi TaxID=1196083 RepID=A0A1X0T9N4_9NEIS|nr:MULTISPECIES: YetF domain-containing protein [Snodgrassella]KEQ00667.1 putative membrane protein [Snodgrassella alvi SCGC AB-598-J21]AHN28412.1 putative membrane protein yetF [Snodgrassella alvi wkB2]MBI0068637.1 DUF421 domain-containing protein [Snodgrassella sp. M0110]MBI0077320.1 DUF421 domain-containing protein [Snodgrassella sp. M0118]MBI0079876.1 DUF421 domain-containing protein [Snodgrassella sp. M0112]
MEYYLWVLAKFLVGFIIVILHLNVTGKTQLNQMTPVDFIGNFVLGGIIGGVIYNQDIPIYQYIIVLLIGVCLISLLNWVCKHVSFIRMFAIGEPIPIMKDGHFLMDNILRKKNKIDILNVASLLHAQGITSFQEVSYAQIEPSGSLTVLTDKGKYPSLILFKEGEVRTTELHRINKDEKWLEQKIQQQHLTEDDLFLVEFWNNSLNFVLRNGEVKKDTLKS